METSSAETSIEMVFESDVHDTAWAIRRIKGKSRVLCQGDVGSKRQFMWFCNDNMDHTWAICSSIKKAQNARPKVWPIAHGTNLNKEEIRYLERGGFILQKAPFD